MGSVTIVDDAKVTQRDLANEFFLTTEDVGECKAKALLTHICELNPDVKGSHMDTGVEEFIDKHHDMIRSS